MYIRKVQSNIKKGVDVELSPKTLIIGPNGSGKSSIINSIELGLTKSVSDLRGKKIVKRGKDLITLAPQGEDLSCVLELSSGKATTLTIPRTDSGAGRAKVKNNLKGALPFLDVLGVLTAKPVVLKEWVVSNVGSVVSRASILDLLEDEDLKQRYTRLAGSSKEDEMVVVKIVATKNTEAIRSYREEVRSIEKALEKLGMNISAPISQDQINALKQQVESEYNHLNALIEHQRTAQNLTHEIRTKREYLTRNMAVLGEYENALDVALTASNLSQPISEQDEFLVALRSKLINMAKVHMALGSKQCMLCLQSEEVHFGSRIQELDGMNQSLSDAIEAHNKREKLEKETTRIRVTVENLASEIMKLEKQYSDHGDIQEIHIDQAKAKWTETTNKIQTHKIQLEQLQSIADMKESAESFKKKVEMAKKLEVAINGIHEKFASNSTSVFMNSVQSYLPSKYKFAIEISDDVHIGFEKDGVIHEALSGAEWATMIMAMSAACADSTIFNVLTPEERAYDPTTLYNVMESLRTCTFQVVLTSTVQPSQIPEGWTIVELE
jgi:DNA repair exonuclease SbcCD ATPase subunit